MIPRRIRSQIALQKDKIALLEEEACLDYSIKKGLLPDIAVLS